MNYKKTSFLDRLTPLLYAVRDLFAFPPIANFSLRDEILSAVEAPHVSWCDLESNFRDYLALEQISLNDLLEVFSMLVYQLDHWDGTHHNYQQFESDEFRRPPALKAMEVLISEISRRPVADQIRFKRFLMAQFPMTGARLKVTKRMLPVSRTRLRTIVKTPEPSASKPLRSNVLFG